MILDDFLPYLSLIGMMYDRRCRPRWISQVSVVKGGHTVAGNQGHISFIYFLQTVILAEFATGNFVDALLIKKEMRRLQIVQADG